MVYGTGSENPNSIKTGPLNVAVRGVWVKESKSHSKVKGEKTVGEEAETVNNNSQETWLWRRLETGQQLKEDVGVNTLDNTRACFCVGGNDPVENQGMSGVPWKDVFNSTPSTCKCELI